MDTFIRTSSTIHYDYVTTILKDGQGGGVEVIEHEYYYDGSGAGLMCMFDDMHNILGIDATSFDGDVTITTTPEGTLSRIDLNCSTGIAKNIVSVTAPWALNNVLDALKKHGLDTDTVPPTIPSTIIVPKED